MSRIKNSHLAKKKDQEVLSQTERNQPRIVEAQSLLFSTRFLELLILEGRVVLQMQVIRLKLILNKFLKHLHLKLLKLPIKFKGKILGAKNRV